MWKIGILTKAIFLYIAENDRCQRVALYNATRTFMINFTRYICSFYNYMENAVSGEETKETQIYVCKDDYSDLSYVFTSDSNRHLL